MTENSNDPKQDLHVPKEFGSLTLPAAFNAYATAAASVASLELQSALLRQCKLIPMATRLKIALGIISIVLVAVSFFHFGYVIVRTFLDHGPLYGAKGNRVWLPDLIILFLSLVSLISTIR